MRFLIQSMPTHIRKITQQIKINANGKYNSEQAL